AGTAGALAGSITGTTLIDTATTSVNIADSSSTGIVAGSISLAASHQVYYEGYTDATQAALVGLSGGDVTNTIASTVTTTVGKSVAL
ncbi:hypothetical protein ABTN40_20135, partial [Acinetobacter baumannii]